MFITLYSRQNIPQCAGFSYLQDCNSNITEIYKKILSCLTSRGIDLLQVTGGGGGGSELIPRQLSKKKNIWPL